MDSARRAPAWGRITAHGAVRWPEAPRAGHEYALPINAATGADLWIFYQPTTSFHNGWEEAPEELGMAALAHCEVIEPGKLRVLEVVVVRELAGRLSADSSGEVPEIPNRPRIRVDWEDLTVIDGSFEGDLGRWMLLQTIDGVHHVLIYGEWDRNSDVVYAGNRPLTREEFRELHEAHG
jgi:hypothetical protein